MEQKLRFRAPNFTAADNILLCDIVSKYKDIIENKKTDGVTLQQKQQAWLEVEKMFNSSTNGCTRTVSSLQQTYKNLKKKLKKTASDAKMAIPVAVDREVLIDTIMEQNGTDWEKISDAVGAPQIVCQTEFEKMQKMAKKEVIDSKKDILGTGGGPSSCPKSDPLLDKVSSLVGPTLDGFCTIYDGDSALMEYQGTVPIEAANQDTSKSPLFTNDRTNLKRKQNVKLSRPSKIFKTDDETVSQKFKKLASEKLELTALNKELLKKQIELEEIKLQHAQSAKTEQDEKLAHLRKLWAIEMEESRKKVAHNDAIRKIELENSNKQV